MDGSAVIPIFVGIVYYEFPTRARVLIGIEVQDEDDIPAASDP